MYKYHATSDQCVVRRISALYQVDVLSPFKRIFEVCFYVLLLHYCPRLIVGLAPTNFLYPAPLCMFLYQVRSL